MSYPKIQKDLEDYLNNIYSFEKVWKEKCSKYDMEEQPSILPPVKRIIVIGDIHGDWEMTKSVLKLAKLVDNGLHWIGGDTVVVQVGDMVDRCRYSGIPCNMKDATTPDEGNDWKILQFFTKLHKEARKVGGAVYSLIGNHELMNVNGDFRYVSYDGLREFDNYETNDSKIIEDGEEARRWAFAPGNDISEFLACTRQAVLIIGSNLFAHAGVLPKIAKKYNVKSINKLLSLYLLDQLDKKSEYRDIFESSSSSPFWNREFGNIGLKELNDMNKSEKKYINVGNKCNDLMKPLKKYYKVGKIYVGHTPMMKHGIGSVCDGQVWLTDVGMSQAFDKFDVASMTSEDKQRSRTRKPQVLEIIDDGVEMNVLVE
jgi:hypothetical protein